MNLSKTPIEGLFLVNNEPFSDSRGYFERLFCRNEFSSAPVNVNFVQVNHSFNLKKGVFRGMHCQTGAFAEDKLVWCIQGEVYDVVLDLRANSPTFLQSFGVHLKAAGKTGIYIPKGLAHGFLTLEENSHLVYFHTNFYNKDNEFPVNIKDPLFSIQLPAGISEISEKDQNVPFLNHDFKGLTL